MLKLLRPYLRADVLLNLIVLALVEGTEQGPSLLLLLSNVMLGVFDHWIWAK